MDRPIVVREAMPADARAIAKVHVAAWRDAYAGILPTGFLVRLDEALQERRFRLVLNGPSAAGHFLVAEIEGEGIVGYAMGGRQRSGLKRIEGEVYALYVDPSAHDRGVGRALMAAHGQAFCERGFGSACVWVLAENPSRWFYAALGGRLFARQTIRFAGVDIEQLAYAWSGPEAMQELRGGHAGPGRLSPPRLMG